MIDTPVVLNVRAIGDVIPMAARMNGVFFVVLRIAQQKIGKIIPREAAIEVEISLRESEIVLDFLIERPTESKLQLVRALGQRDVVAKLVVVRRVVPRFPTGSVIGSSTPIQVDRRNAAVGVWPGEQPVKGKSRGCREQALREDVDAVAVIVERRFVEQSRADHVSAMYHGAIGRVSESIADCRHVIGNPLRCTVSLRNLFGNPVPEYRELAGK